MQYTMQRAIGDERSVGAHLQIFALRLTNMVSRSRQLAIICAIGGKPVGKVHPVTQIILMCTDSPGRKKNTFENVAFLVTCCPHYSSFL